MSENSDGNKDLAGSSVPRCSDREQLENGTFESNQGQVLLSNCGIQVENKIGQDLGSSRERSGCVSGVGNLLPQQAVSQGTTVCWERFLHVRSLKVLLVENDDCTRHLVAALLQNCSYEVVEAANGFQAWRILEDTSNRIDIVLTEVVMPCASGLALLNKIMSHKTRKSIPVIMMSSHDSMGVVFKCLSKGAADFLVKPLRKNELKNLWQHVWRRCHSSSGSGSGSESGTHTKKSVKFQNDEKSDNNSGSNDEEDNGSPPLDFGDGSDHGSGTQNFWTKQAIEEQDESPRSMSPANELSESPDSTCAQVIHSNIKQCGKQLEPMSAARECKEQTEQPEESEMGKPHISKLPNSSDLLFKSLVEVPVELLSMNHGSSPKLDSSQFSKPLNNSMDLNCVNPATEPDNQVAGIIPGSSDPHKESNDSDRNNKYSKISNIDGITAGDGRESQHPEQSLKRLRGTQDGKVVMDDRNILKRSISSAFSRYNAALYSKAATTDARNSSPLEIRPDRIPAAMHNMQSCTGSNMPNQRSNGRIPYKDMISTSNSDFIETINNKDQSSESQRAKHEYHPAVQMHPAHYSARNNPSIDNLPQQNQLPNGDLLLTEKAGSSTHCQSSSMAGRHLEGTAGNYSMNGSGSGSNHGSNEPNGSGSAPNAGGVNMQLYDMTGCQSDNGNASGSGSGSGSGNKLDPDKLAQREAALIKYRQKRKELCFKRTVRYQSRKKLAEQRPRIRGQFVKRTLSETSSQEPTDTQI